MLNKILLQGRLTKNVELKHTEKGDAIAFFSVAWNTNYGDKERTCFFNCVAFRSRAEFIEKYFSKGDMLSIDGQLQTRSYEDNTGVKRTVTEIIVNEVHFCGKKNTPNEDFTSNDDIF